MQEIGAALRDFRASGKRVMQRAILQFNRNTTAAQAGRVYLDPMGKCPSTASATTACTTKDRDRKAQRRFETLFRAGTFKSYTDQFSRNDMAPSEREETSVWLVVWHAYTGCHARPVSAAGALKDFIAEQPCLIAGRQWATWPRWRCSAAW